MADGGAETSQELISVVDEGFGTDVQALQDGGGGVGDKAAFLRVDSASDGVDQLQIVSENKGNAGGKGFRRIEGEQGGFRQIQDVGIGRQVKCACLTK